ncbi:unnamed protein product [Effrenium voratum]|nr:unnamed protein product [Effrenium voratum]
MASREHRLQDAEWFVLSCCDKQAQVLLSSASKVLRSGFGQWLVAEYADRVPELESRGFFYCKLFVQHGGLDIQITTHLADRPFRKGHKASPLDILEMAATRRHGRFSDTFFVFYDFACASPCFLGSVLSMIFSRLQAAGLLEDTAGTKDAVLARFLTARRTLQAVARNWLTGLTQKKQRNPQGGLSTLASMICSIPSAEAAKSGVASWFVRVAKEGLLDVVGSSTETFLTLQDDCRDPDGKCIQLMNILAAASHCGHATKASARMFESCLQRIVECVSDNLGPFPDCGVQLHEVLSVLAKANPKLCNKRMWIREVLEKALSRHEGPVTESNDIYLAEGILNLIFDGHHLVFLPTNGFSSEECQQILRFQCTIFDLAAPRVCNCFEDAVGDSPWKASIVKGFLAAKTETPRLRTQETQINARRRGWIQACLRGIVAYLRQHGISVAADASHNAVVFSNADIADIQSVCQEHPFIKDVLEEFVDNLLALRGGEAA